MPRSDMQLNLVPHFWYLQHTCVWWLWNCLFCAFWLNWSFISQLSM